MSNEVGAQSPLRRGGYGEAAPQSLTRLSRVTQLSPHLGNARAKFVVTESKRSSGSNKKSPASVCTVRG